jgi:O-antigen ligase
MAVAMLTRKGFLYLAPIMIGIYWRFAAVTAQRNFTVDEVVFLVALIKIIQELIGRRLPSRVPVIKWYVIFLAVMLFTYAEGILLSQSFDRSMFNDVVLLKIKERLYFPIVYLATFILIRTPDEGLKVLRWTALIAIPLCLYAIIQFHFFILPGEGTSSSFWLYSWYNDNFFWVVFTMRRAFGTLNHPSALGRYMMFTVVLGIALAIHRTKLKWRRMGLVAAVIGFYTLGISGSRGPMLALGVAMALLLYLERRAITRNLVIFLIFVFTLSFAVPEVMSERMGTFVEEGMNEANVDARFEWWNENLSKVLDENPLTGLGPQYETGGYDSDFVYLIVEGGILLLIAFGLVLAAIAWHGYAGIRWGDDLAQMAGVIVIGCIVAAIGAALSGQTFLVTKIGLEFFFILGVCNKIISISLESRLLERNRYRLSDSEGIFREAVA